MLTCATRLLTSWLPRYADHCDALNMAGSAGCNGFNNNGFMKRCIHESCGAHAGIVPDHPALVSCVRTTVPSNQPTPTGNDPSCKSGGGGGGNDPFPYANGCAGTSNRSTCNCAGVRPPFGKPERSVPLQNDYHFPVGEAAEREGLPTLVLVATTASTATITKVTAGDSIANDTATLQLGDTKWGWELLLAASSGTSGTSGAAVVEHKFGEWAELRFLDLDLDRDLDRAQLPNPHSSSSSSSVSIRKPVGFVDSIDQPIYDFSTVDPQYHCKQDIDPTDWMGHLAANISGGEEATPQAAGTLMAPNTDSGTVCVACKV